MTATRKSPKIELLDHGHVVLVDSCGNDLRIVNFARASYDKFSDSLSPGDKKLIGFLMRHRHGTPFEAVDLTFHVKCPIAVNIEWLRHRISSFNAKSFRYVSARDSDFYVPQGAAIRQQIGKAGHYQYVPIPGRDEQDFIAYTMRRAYQTAMDTYDSLIEAGLAREVARNVLPVGMYTEFYWKVNARSLMNFLSLRNADNAMREIREYADAVEELVQDVIPVTMAEFVRQGRIAP